MSPIRKLLFVCVGVLALHGVQACTSETELNPQPLPPQGGGGDNSPAPGDPAEKQGDTTAGSSGSSGGSSGAPVPPVPLDMDGGDGGDGDATDAGVH